MLLPRQLSCLRTLALPKALSWSALALGVSFITPVGIFTLFALPLWTLGAGVVLYRKNTRTPAAGTVPAPQPA